MSLYNENFRTVRANAKVNLTLRVTGVLPDGFHSISTIFQEIDLCDLLTFSPSNFFSLSCLQNSSLSNKSNLCTIAYKVMKRLVPDRGDFHIDLEKNIPSGAGLGGGSSDAAAVIKFLNEVWNVNLSYAELLNIAKEIGSDVPFYIRGGTQAAEGRGEILYSIKLPEDFVLLLVCPEIHISTRWAYNQLDLTKLKKRYKFNDLFNKDRVFWNLFENQFESVVFPVYPELKKIKEDLIKLGARYAGLSGSGSTVFGIFGNLEEVDRVKGSFSQYRTFTSLPIF